MATRRRPTAADQQPEHVIQPLQDLLDPERTHPRRRQLDRQGQALEAGTDGRQHRCAARRHAKVRLDRLSAFDEQLRRRKPHELVGTHDRARIGNGQRGYPPRSFARDLEGLAAGRQHAHAWAALFESLNEVGTHLDEVLAVVQHEQHLTARQVGHERVEQRSIRPLAHAEHRRDRLRHQQWVRQRGKFHQPDAVLERADEAGGDPESEPSLAAAADAGQGDEVPITTEHQGAQVSNLPIASDEGRGVGGQVVVAVRRQDRASHRIPSAKVPPLLACAKQRQP